MAATDNLSIALGVVSRTDWLAQVDTIAEITFEALLRQHRFADAAAALLAHLTRTEVTRTRVHGPAPDWPAAVQRFEEALARQAPEHMALIHLFLVGGVNATRPALSGAYRPAGPKDPSRAAAPPSAAGSCASDVPTLVPLPGPLCGHVDPLTGMRCVSDEHPANPRGHYYRSSCGSDVADHHSRTEAQED